MSVFIQAVGDKVTGSGGVFEGDVPLPRVFSLLSFMLMASDAPSGICEGREEDGGSEGGRERRDEERTEGMGVRGELGSTRAASLSMPSRGVLVLRGACVCVLALRASRVVARLQEAGWAH